MASKTKPARVGERGTGLGISSCVAADETH
jgi:hypothetical protein